MTKDINTYYNRQSTRTYAIAMALHMKNLLYTFGINLFDEKITDEMIQKTRDLIENEDTLHSLMRSDMRLWNCYFRGAGFQKIDFDEVPKYYKKVSSIYQHTMAQLNPCLTDLDEYEKHEDDTLRLFGKKMSYIKAERNYIRYIPKILEELKKKGY